MTSLHDIHTEINSLHPREGERRQLHTRLLSGMFYYKKLVMSQPEISFIKEIIIELLLENVWFPPNVYKSYKTEDRAPPTLRLRLRYIQELIVNEFCTLWVKHHKKYQSYKTTLLNMYDDDMTRKRLIDILKRIKQRITDKKIHNKFVKENNVKLKENIIRTLNKETPKKDKLNNDIKQLEELLKSKKEKLKESQSKIEDANDMKAILIFPGVCKDIYSIFSENKSKPELIFHNPNDITIRVVEYLKELSN